MLKNSFIWHNYLKIKYLQKKIIEQYKKTKKDLERKDKIYFF